MRKLIVCLLTVLAFSTSALGQDSKKADISVGTDVVSRYVWRGTDFSNSPCFQPGFEISKSGLAFGAWGSYSFNGLGGAEMDLYLSYTFLNEMLTVTVTDYFFPVENAATNKYFMYEASKTGHVLEGMITFNGTDDLPLSFTAATNFFGDDARVINDDPSSADFNKSTGIQYSTYLELAYSMDINGTDVEVFAGFTPNKPRSADNATGYIGESGFYGKTMGFVNVGFTGSKEIKISEEFSLPVSSSLIVNPMAENIFLVFGFSL